MIFGEPDVSITKTKDGRLIAEIHGVDVYDPTTGEIRSHSTDGPSLADKVAIAHKWITAGYSVTFVLRIVGVSQTQFH